MDHLLDNDSDEDRDDDLVEQTGKSGYIFLIDARKSMFDGDESYFKKSFQCCYDSMLQLAREQSYDLVSIVLFGTSKSEGKFAPPGIVLYLPLLTTTIDNIRMVKQLIDDGFNQIIGKYGHGKEVVIEKALDYCKKNLYYSPKKLVSKSIILFTNDDNPHKNDEMSAHKARKRAEEIFMHQMELNVVGFGNFDSNIFYKELVLTTRGELLKDWVGRDPIKNVDIIQKDLAIFTRKFKRHFGIFHLGGEAKLPVVFYKLYSEPKRLIWTTKSSEAKNEYNADYKKEVDPLSLCESIYQADTQVDVEETDSQAREPVQKPKKYPFVGGKLIPMTKEELKLYGAKVLKGLTLIGFKPLSSISKHCVLGKPYFLYPDLRHKPSEKVFSCLLHSCLKQRVAPVCWYSASQTGNPVLTALYPTEPSEYAKGRIHPDGFHLIQLPFADMITEYSEEDSKGIEPSDDQRVAAKKIIKKTQVSWFPETFSDFEFNSRIAMIEAIAMEYSNVKEIVDTTDFDLEAVSKRLGDLNTRFNDCSHLPHEFSNKRSTSDSGETSTKRKELKTEDTTSLISRIKNGEANKLTAAQLRDLLKLEGVRSLSALSKSKLVLIANERFGSNV